MYISSVLKLRSLYIICFKVAESRYHEWIKKEEVLKMRNPLSGLPAKYLLRKAEFVTLNKELPYLICHGCIKKEEVLKLWSLYIMSGSTRKKF